MGVRQANSGPTSHIQHKRVGTATSEEMRSVSEADISHPDTEAAAGHDGPRAPADQNGPNLGIAGPGRTEPPPRFDNIAVLGHISWLMSQSPEHRNVFVTDLEWRVMPAVALGQFRIWRQGNRPIAYASWAFVGPHQKARLNPGTIRLSPGEWKIGNTAVIVDVVAPFGGLQVIRREVEQMIRETPP